MNICSLNFNLIPGEESHLFLPWSWLAVHKYPLILSAPLPWSLSTVISLSWDLNRSQPMFTIFLSQKITQKKTQSQWDCERDQWLRDYPVTPWLDDCPLILVRTSFCWVNQVTILVAFDCSWIGCLRIDARIPGIRSTHKIRVVDLLPQWSRAMLSWGMNSCYIPLMSKMFLRKFSHVNFSYRSIGCVICWPYYYVALSWSADSNHGFDDISYSPPSA